MKNLLLLTILILFYCNNGQAQALYFPPLIGNAWQTVSPESLGWNPAAQENLLAYLDAKHSKAFMILKDGKIVIESYWNGFGPDSLWYWASAGKSLTSVLVGRAQTEGLLSIEDSVSQYLGNEWTIAPPEKEGKIKIYHNLSMTTGLDWNIPNDDCTIDTCLAYRTEAGTEWYYFNAPYHLLHEVVEAASGVGFQQFTNSRLTVKTGIRGLWSNYVFYSKARDMARFGLLALNKGKWADTEVIGDSVFFASSVQSSQNLNPAYGYLWWLNGKEKYRLPQTQFLFDGMLVPAAPPDMFMALGKNDQKIYVVPSQKLVVIRMGESADLPSLALSSFDNEMWIRINAMTGVNPVADLSARRKLNLFVDQDFKLQISDIQDIVSLEIYDLASRKLISGSPGFSISTVPKGIYRVRAISVTGLPFYTSWVNN